MFSSESIEVFRGGIEPAPEWLVAERFRLAMSWHGENGMSPTEYGCNATPRTLEATRAFMDDDAYWLSFARDPRDPCRLAGVFDGFVGRLPHSLSRGDDEEFYEADEYFDRMNKGGRHFGNGVNGYYLMVDGTFVNRGLGKLLAEFFTGFDFGPQYSFLFCDLAIPGVLRVQHIFVDRLGYRPSNVVVDAGEDRWTVMVKERPGYALSFDKNGVAMGTVRA